MKRNSDINLQIEKAKHELEHMIDLNPSVMLLVDHSGTIARANKALLKLLNVEDFTNILNRKLDEAFECEDKTFMTGLVENRTKSDHMEAAVNISNEKRLLRFTIIGSSPTADLFALIINDITSENEMATQREKTHKKEAVKALMGALLHNVNQPLTVIMMRAHLMHLELEKGNNQTEALSNSLRDIMRQTADIAALLRQVEVPSDYVTESYPGGIDILNIKRSAGDTDFDLSNIGIPQALILALDVHDPGALKHAQSGCACALLIAEQMELNKTECDTIKRCALMHDIGKLGIPSSILQKPGLLDDAEISLMQQHPQIGYKLLQNFHFLKDEAETAHTHAEWFDGNGYPQGLSGEQIPLRARIVSVADAYSAITEERSYKKASSSEEALAEISKYSGTQFDPEIVKALITSLAR